MNHLERSHPYRCGADLRFGITESQFRSDAIHDVSPRVCKRCLASLAKRDRAFWRKARRWVDSDGQKRHLRVTLGWEGMRAILYPYMHASRKADAARAVAREEGRIQ